MSGSNRTRVAGREIKETFDVVVAGGGLAGVCAAIASARGGGKTALVQDRPVLGGNSSSEIRVPPGGANCCCAWARETGIIEEIMIEDRARNHDPVWEGTMNSQWDMRLYEAVRAEPKLTLHLNTSVRGVEMKGKSRIACLIAEQAQSERRLKLNAKYFIDCTGDGTVGAAAGATFRYGRESRKEFGESRGPLKADDKTQGNTLMFRARDVGRPVVFTPPEWAETYPTVESLHKRRIHSFNKKEYAGYWWIEVGVPFHTIDDNEAIREEILRHLMGVWDHIKNHGDYGADNLALDWIGTVPGKRESRRLVGDYILREQDLFERTPFPDRVAYGGWFVDVHTMGGILAKGKPPEALAGNHDLLPTLGPPLYNIPLRSLYSKNISNLFMAGRNLSATHLALGSARLMLTCALMGQAVGTAAPMCIRRKVPPKQLAKKHIADLQQQLLKDDCFIPEVPNRDPKDLALGAKAEATSQATLSLDPVDASLGLEARRAQVFPVSASRVDTIGLHLKSSADKETTVELEFLPAVDIWSFNGEREPESVRVKPIKATATVPAGHEGWVDFAIGADVEPGLYRINVVPAAGISWSQASAVPGVAAGYRKPAWKRYAGHRVAFSMRLDPPSKPFGPENVTNGVARPESGPNLWVSDPAKGLPQSLTVDLGKPARFSTVYLTFDTMLFKDHRAFPGFHRIAECVSDYEIQVQQKGKWQTVDKVTGNYQRHRIHRFKAVKSRRIRIKVAKTNGADTARIYEVRVYNEEERD